jgi:Zn-dependent metalloprotease
MRTSRVRRLIGVAAAASCVAGVLASAASASAVSTHRHHWTAAKRAVPHDVRFVQTRRSLLGTHTWYQQTVRGIPVYGGWYGVHAFTSGKTRIDDERARLRSFRLGSPRISRAGAAAIAVRNMATKRALRSQTPRVTRLYVLPGASGHAARLSWLVNSSGAGTEVRTFVDAGKGMVLKQIVRSEHKTGHGRVFNPNPVVSLQDESLRDHGDANSAVPQTAYSTATLSNLNAGTNKLVGRWARIVNPNGASSASGSFLYYRENNYFEQVNAYYAVDRAQTYFRSIGFNDANAESQDIKTDAFSDDNSFYTRFNDRISFGTGGVDDAEDQEVVWHEYGHAVQDDQIPGFGETEEAGAMGEGWGDYLAFTMSQGNSPNSPTTPLACIADWDAVSYTSGSPHCLRRVDGNKTYPDDLVGEVHDDGEIWSRALYDINRSLGRDRANRVILQGQFSWAPDEGFVDGATAIKDAANNLYGPPAANQVQAAFHARGIL